VTSKIIKADNFHIIWMGACDFLSHLTW